MKRQTLCKDKMSNISREKKKVLGRNQKKMLEIKYTITEMKNTFNELMSRFDIVEQSMSLKIGQ